MYSLVTRYSCVLLLLLLLPGRSWAQQPTPAASSILIISPLVGEVIDGAEKARFGLFPTISANDFQEARFLRSLAADSTVTLHLQLRDGRTLLRPYSPAQVQATRLAIETRQRELATLPPAAVAAADSAGRRYRVTLQTGTAFDGELVSHTPQQIRFLTTDLGVVAVERSNIQRLQELNSEVARRPSNWMDIGNGNRLFFAPTARNLRQGEGALQALNLYVIGANYGITNNFSMGLLFSAIPGVPLHDQFLALTPKLSTKLSDKWHIGAGLLYLRIPDFGQSNGSFGVGLGYGVATYGSADDNFTVGLGYGFAGGEVGSTPVLQIGGQKRVSRRVSLISENYLIANGDAGMGGLYGAKINWRRTSLGLGAAYALPYSEGRGFSSYIVPLYYDFTFRFGKPTR